MADDLVLGNEVDFEDAGLLCENISLKAGQDMESVDLSLTDENQNKKREREEESSNDEEWQQVLRRRSKKRYSEDIQISVTSREKFPKQFALAKLMKAQSITGIMRIRFVNPFKLFISFNSEESAEKFIECQDFKVMGWRSQKTWEVGISYGMIRDMDIELKEEDIGKIIKSETEIISVKRLNRRSEEGWVPCESVRIGFLGAKIPAYICLYDLRIKVEPYIFPTTQCAKCWRFGHVKKLCPSNKLICPKCAKFHENCETTSYKCTNCGGNHMAMAKSCPVYIKERKIRELMSDFNVTYRKALTMYVPPSPIPKRTPRSDKHMPITINNSFSGLDAHPDTATIPTTLFTTPHRTYANAAGATQYSLQTGLKPSYRNNKNNLLKLHQSKDAKNKVQNSLQERMNYIEDSSECSSDSESNNREEEQSEHLISFEELLNRLKEIVFLKNCNFLTKLHDVFKIIRDWSLAYLCEKMSELPLVKKLLLFFNGS